MIEFKKHTLSNGLRVIVHQDKTTPFAALNLAYNVGSKNEDPEHTGFAHLFEHLMFGGSKNIPDFDSPIQNAGGNNNAFTSVDITNYYITVPSQNLETAFWLESDRMLELDFSQKSLDVQKKVVIEEFNQNYLNRPYGDVWHLFRELAYKVHPYSWPTIGKETGHVEKATLEMVKEFFYSHYAPNNAVLVLAGDVEFDECIALAEKWFGPIPNRKLDERPIPKEPKQEEDRHLTVERDVPLDAVFLGWHMGARAVGDYFAVDLLSDVLANGKSSRLKQKLMNERELFVELDAFITGENHPGLFVATGKVKPGVDYEEAVAALKEEVLASSTTDVSEYELQKVKNKAEANLLYNEVGYLEKAIQLASYEILGNANEINTQINHYDEITVDDIKRVATDIFREGNMNQLNYLSNKKA